MNAAKQAYDDEGPALLCSHWFWVIGGASVLLWVATVCWALS